MNYIGKDIESSGPRDPSPAAGGWVAFVAGQLVRCAVCNKAIGKVGSGTQILVRRAQVDPGALCLMHRCHKCRGYLEIRQVDIEEQVA